MAKLQRLKCPVCNRIHFIKDSNKNFQVKCICGSELMIVTGLNGKSLIKINDTRRNR